MHIICIILDNKYEKSDIKTFMKEQCQHLIPRKLESLFNLLKIFKDLFYGTLGTWLYRPIRLGIKGLYKASVLVTLSSTEGARGHVYKFSSKTSKFKCVQRSKRLKMGSTIFCPASGKNESNKILKLILELKQSIKI